MNTNLIVAIFQIFLHMHQTFLEPPRIIFKMSDLKTQIDVVPLAIPIFISLLNSSTVYIYIYIHTLKVTKSVLYITMANKINRTWIEFTSFAYLSLLSLKDTNSPLSCWTDFSYWATWRSSDWFLSTFWKLMNETLSVRQIWQNILKKRSTTLIENSALFPTSTIHLRNRKHFPCFHYSYRKSKKKLGNFEFSQTFTFKRTYLIFVSLFSLLQFPHGLSRCYVFVW